MFVDEEVPVHVVLRTKLLDEDVLEAYLNRLAISLEARAYGTLHVKAGESEKSVSANELLFSGAISRTEEPIICATEVQHEGQDEPIQYVYIFWKLLVPIGTRNHFLALYSMLIPPSKTKSKDQQAVHILHAFRSIEACGDCKTSRNLGR